MQTNDFKGKKIAVLGAGVEGLTSVEYLQRHGAIVTIRDQRETFDEATEKKLSQLQVQVMSGENYLHGLDAYDIIVRSPGVPLALPELIAAKEKGILVTSQTKLFFQLTPAPVVGVTGTKGKGTTAALIAEMLRTEGLDVHLGGNIGVPPLTFLDELKPTSWVVLELSSFQLEDLDQSPADAMALAGKPHIAVMLMIVPEHLGRDSMGTQNYHETMEDYIAAKRNLLRWQTPTDYAVLNRDYPATHESDIYTEGKAFQVSREREAAGDGCFVRQGRLLIRRDGKEREIIQMKEVLLPGRHNWENICAGAMAATLAGVSAKSIAAVLRTFKGLEHRLELVREVHGVKYYDDSFSTTPETAIAAIEAFDSPEILILGGSSKNSDFTALGELISTRVNIRAVIGIGQEWERIKSKFRVQSSEFRVIEGLENMQQIVQAAADIAEPGDVVLLSPACASFGMFTNYKDRGKQFKDAVASL